MERQHRLRDIATKLLRRMEDHGHATLEITGEQGGLLIPLENLEDQAEYYRQGYTHVYIVQTPTFWRLANTYQNYYYLKPDGHVLGMYVNYMDDKAPTTGDINLPEGTTYSLQERWTEDPPVKQVKSHRYIIGDRHYFEREQENVFGEAEITYATRRSNLSGGEKHPAKAREAVLYLHVPKDYAQRLMETTVSGWARIVHHPTRRRSYRARSSHDLESAQ